MEISDLMFAVCLQLLTRKNFWQYKKTKKKTKTLAAPEARRALWVWGLMQSGRVSRLV